LKCNTNIAHHIGVIQQVLRTERAGSQKSLEIAQAADIG
jgi:hypothetical protein